jgi:RsiW-degrading membrane proteinase PrsW (M82 family)
MDLNLALKAAIAMAPVLALLVAFDRVDVFKLISLRRIAALVLVGGLIAGLAYLANGGLMQGFPIDMSNYSRYVAPEIEEGLKAAAVIALFTANRIGYKLDAAITGFAIGAGFSMVENGLYLQIQADANVSAWLVRGLGTAVMHGGATALFAAISHEMTERQAQSAATRYVFDPFLFLPGLALAIVLHSAFNHFGGQPMLAMILTFVLVPRTLFLVFQRGEAAQVQWLESDRAAHARALADIRSGRFAASSTGQLLAGEARKVGKAGRIAEADLWAYAELKTELILRAEEILLSEDDDGEEGERPQPLKPDETDREKFARLAAVEKQLGRLVTRTLDARLGFTRNDLWELGRLRAKVARA